MKTKTIDFEDFLANKCDTHTNNDPAGFERWLEQLDIQELQDYGQEFGEKCFEEGKHFEEEQMGDAMSKDKIAGVDFKPAIDSLEKITGVKLSDMLGKPDTSKEMGGATKAQDDAEEEVEICEKCGEETGQKMVGDETYNFCKDCNWVTH